MQQRVGAEGQPEGGQDPGTALAAERQGDRLDDDGQAGGPSRIGRDDGRHVLREGLAGAAGGATVEAAQLEIQPHR